MPKPSEGKLLYHMTRLENMPSILKHGLLSRKWVQELKLDFLDIANPDILDGRENVQSPRPLSEYVPFHFFAGNPFDYGVCRAYGSENMVIITIPRALARSHDYPIITAHPINRTVLPEIYSYEEGIERIDWKTLDLEYPNRDYDDNVIKQKCMAECLVPDSVSLADFASIFVYSAEIRAKIQKMPYACHLRCYINDNDKMFPPKR